MRYVRRRPKKRESYIYPGSPTQAVRKYDDGREVTLANAAGRAEYVRRKQLLWEEQHGSCAYCQQKMSLLACRLTGGRWTEPGEEQNRDDRLVDREGRKINCLVCKDCLRDWHSARARADRTRAFAQSAVQGTSAGITAISNSQLPSGPSPSQ